MDVFHVFKIVQMAPNREKHHKYFFPTHEAWSIFDINKLLDDG